MEIKTNDYEVRFDPAVATVFCKGSFRLGGVDEYTPIAQLLHEAASTQPEVLTLNLTELEFLNSSGINILSKFVISVRQKGGIQMVVQGSKRVPWQGKSLQNLQRLMPGLKLELN